MWTYITVYIQIQTVAKELAGTASEIMTKPASHIQ